MEKSALAILTFNRWKSLSSFLEGIKASVDLTRTAVAVFEDCGYMDETRSEIMKDSELMGYVPEVDADVYRKDGVLFHLGRHNLGVAGNTNRALQWADATNAEHIVVANDDLIATGDFVREYLEAHKRTGIGMFCFNDFAEWPTHRWGRAFYRGVEIKIFPRMTGICMSITRLVLKTIGYFDVRIGKFGEEHCEYTNRARLCSFLDCDNQPQACVDIQNVSLKHQEVASTVSADEKPLLDRLASRNLQKVHEELLATGRAYRKFELVNSEFAGATGVGVGFKTSVLPYPRVVTLGV